MFRAYSTGFRVRMKGMRFRAPNHVIRKPPHAQGEIHWKVLAKLFNRIQGSGFMV
jgi:hypothetical protein